MEVQGSWGVQRSKQRALAWWRRHDLPAHRQHVHAPGRCHDLGLPLALHRRQGGGLVPSGPQRARLLRPVRLQGKRPLCELVGPAPTLQGAVDDAATIQSLRLTPTWWPGATCLSLACTVHAVHPPDTRTTPGRTLLMAMLSWGRAPERVLICLQEGFASRLST